MATYDELIAASNDSALGRKIMVACTVSADKIRAELDTVPNHANRLAWAKAAFRNPTSAMQDVLWCVLAQNRAVPLASIIGATDAIVQTAVDAAIDVVADGA